MVKKVVHLVYSFGCGGLEKVIANLINYSTQYDVEHIVISLTNDTSMVNQIHRPIKMYVLDKQAGNDLTSHRKLYRLLKTLAPHAINTYNFGTIEYHFTAKLAGVPVRVHSDHGRGGDDPQGKNTLHNLFRKFISHFITEYIVVSYDIYLWITQTLKINNKKVSLLYNGVFIPQAASNKNIPPKKFVTVGRLDPVKNQSLLIDAFSQAKKMSNAMSNCTLDIVGDGPLYQTLAAKIEEKNMVGSINLLGFRDDIGDILKASDVFVLSSVYEAMPMTILEAMANKTPVICTDVGGISKFITEQEAWFVPSENSEALAQKLIDVVTSTTQTQDKISNAYDLVSNNYAVEQMIKNYMNKYQIPALV